MKIIYFLELLKLKLREFLEKAKISPKPIDNSIYISFLFPLIVIQIFGGETLSGRLPYKDFHNNRPKN